MAFGFLTNTEAREKITGLESRITELENDATARDEELSTARADLATANESLVTANARVTELESGDNSDLTAANERISALETEVATIPALKEAAKHTDDKVKLEASRMLAASGHPSPVDDPEGGSEGPKTMSRANFVELSSAARAEFIRAGGRPTD